MTRIAVLLHASDRLDLSRFFLGPIARIWEERGIEVRLVNDPAAATDADAAMLHVNLTTIPQPYVDFVRRYPVAINAGASDIAKRTISRGILQQDSSYEGCVIVKTNLNCGGGREHCLARRRWHVGLPRWAARRLPWRWRPTMDPARYPIFDSIAEVPAGVWQNPRLVVEKFRPEMRDGHYCLRTWCFLGDRETNSISYSKSPIVKLSNVVRREVVPEVPEALRDMRRRLGFDFGKFDYAVVDGEVVLYDANRTPSVGRASEKLRASFQTLAAGIDALLAARPRPATAPPSPAASPSEAPEPADHWSQVARRWEQIGAPLRPVREDLDCLTRHIRAWSGDHGPPRALVFGVTPEIRRLPWPEGATVRAVDHTPAMIGAIWPGAKSEALCAEWTELPLATASVDLAFCDGGLHLMDYPDGQQAFARAVQRVVAPGGRCLLRLFLPPRDGEQETARQVVDALLRGEIADLNVLKFRLWGALQRTPEEGVALADVWRAVHDVAGDLPTLAARLGWDADHLAAIDTYRHSAGRYHLVTLEQAKGIFCGEGGAFSVADVFTPAYPLGERCPTLVLERAARKGE